MTRSAAAIFRGEPRSDRCVGVTLLELVVAAGAVTASEDLVTAKVRNLLASGRVRLTGNFAGLPIDQFLESALPN